MPVYDLICTNDHLQENAVRSYRKYGICPICHEDCRPYWKQCPAIDIWGGPQFVTSLDRQFDSKSELKETLKEYAMEPAGDRVGGARNEDGFKRSTYSYKGQARRGDPTI